MNQNQQYQQKQQKYKRIRQVTPQEVAQAQGISVEEIQKTQILNLKAVEDAIRFEKLTSKKPALIVAIFGIMFILFGTTFQIVKTVQSKPSEVIEKRETKEVVVEKTEQVLHCQQISNSNGLDKDYEIVYQFKDNQLTGVTKTLQFVSKDSTIIQSYNNTFQSYLNPSKGYNIQLEKIDSGIKLTVEIDYSQLDLMKLNPQQQQHYSTKVDYPVDTVYSKIKTDMINESYKCQ